MGQPDEPQVPETPIIVSLHMNHADFLRLTQAAYTTWFPANQIDEYFEVHDVVGAPNDGQQWSYAYYFGETTADMMLAKAFLETLGHSYALAWDPETDNGWEGWLILTDYGDAQMAEMKVHNDANRERRQNELDLLDELYNTPPLVSADLEDDYDEFDENGWSDAGDIDEDEEDPEEYR